MSRLSSTDKDPAPVERKPSRQRAIVLVSVLMGLQPLNVHAENDRSEPSPEVFDFRCVCSQRENCGTSEKLRAGVQQNKRPFVLIAA